jgi:hypothetical protein
MATFLTWNATQNVSRVEHNLKWEHHDKERLDTLAAVKDQIKAGLDTNAEGIRRVEAQIIELRAFLMRRADAGKLGVGRLP